MITFPNDVLALFDEGRISVRGLIRFNFGTGTYGFIRANAPFNYLGLDYMPGGLLSVSDFAEESGLTADQFTITLAASPDDGLTPDVLKTIEAEDYRDRPVTIMDAFFHPDTNELLHVQTMKRGYVDTIDHIDNAKSGGYMLVANCESRSLDYQRTNGRKRNDVDQRRRSATDGFFIHASTRGRENVYWGREDPTKPNSLQSVLLTNGKYLR